jgi:hypothetical protein
MRTITIAPRCTTNMRTITIAPRCTTNMRTITIAPRWTTNMPSEHNLCFSGRHDQVVSGRHL